MSFDRMKMRGVSFNENIDLLEQISYDPHPIYHFSTQNTGPLLRCLKWKPAARRIPKTLWQLAIVWCTFSFINIPLKILQILNSIYLAHITFYLHSYKLVSMWVSFERQNVKWNVLPIIPRNNVKHNVTIWRNKVLPNHVKQEINSISHYGTAVVNNLACFTC